MIREYRSSDWEAVRAVYDLAKPDEMRGVVPTDSVIPLNSNRAMLTLFEESKILVFELEGGSLASVDIDIKRSLSSLFILCIGGKQSRHS